MKVPSPLIAGVSEVELALPVPALLRLASASVPATRSKMNTSDVVELVSLLVRLLALLRKAMSCCCR